MRTNIDIDDQKMQDAMKLLGTRNKRETVATALDEVIRIRKQVVLRELFGTVEWIGDLDEMRRDD